MITTPFELFLAAVFVLPTLVFLLYLAVVLYRCVCSRNYAEWRDSWKGDASENKGMYSQVREKLCKLLASTKKVVLPLWTLQALPAYILCTYYCT